MLQNHGVTMTKNFWSEMATIRVRTRKGRLGHESNVARGQSATFTYSMHDTNLTNHVPIEVKARTRGAVTGWVRLVKHRHAERIMHDL